MRMLERPEARTQAQSAWLQARRLATTPLRSSLGRALLEPLVAPRSLDDYLELVDPCWSLDQVRARIVAVKRETDDVTSLWLEPNDNWRPHRAGQHVLLTAEVDGSRHTRSFSLSEAPRAGAPLRVTIKAHPQGRVSGWARDRARAGDIVTISLPQGDFVLPDPVPEKLLFVSGGSGMTPLVAMAQQLVADGYRGELLWVHSDRDAIPLEDDLRALTDALPNATLRVHQSAVPGQAKERYLMVDQLIEWVADYQERQVFICGPRGLMELVESLYAKQSLSTQVHSEDYQPRWSSAALAPRKNGEPYRLEFVQSGRRVDAQPGVSLLEQAERAGLHPAHGCRRGICLSCKCKKLEGTVRNELTGVESDAPGEEIQLCIHTPVSGVRIEL